MTVGLRLKDENNNLTFDVTTRTGQFFGSFQTNGNASGSFTDSSIKVEGTFFAYAANQGSEYGGPVVTANLATGFIEWEYDIALQNYAQPDYPDDTVFYGVY